jgi:hypothetical protein
MSNFVPNSKFSKVPEQERAKGLKMAQLANDQKKTQRTFASALATQNRNRGVVVALDVVIGEELIDLGRRGAASQKR